MDEHYCDGYVCIDAVIVDAPRLWWDGVGAAGTFSFTGLVCGHSILVPFFEAGVLVSRREGGKVGDDVCVIDDSVCLRQELGVICCELVISYSRLTEGVNCVCALVERFDVSGCQNGKGTAQTMSRDVNS